MTWGCRKDLEASLRRAEEKGTPSSLDKALAMCESRVAAFETMGWEALAKSWRKDLDKVQRLIRQLEKRSRA